MQAHGVDHGIVDDGQIVSAVRAKLPTGVETALELVGTPTLPDTLRATRAHGTVCFTGMLSNRWTVDEFYPIDYIPRAHANLELNRVFGKLVGVIDPAAAAVTTQR